MVQFRRHGTGSGLYPQQGETIDRNRSGWLQATDTHLMDLMDDERPWRRR